MCCEKSFLLLLRAVKNLYQIVLTDPEKSISFITESRENLYHLVLRAVKNLYHVVLRAVKNLHHVIVLRVTENLYSRYLPSFYEAQICDFLARVTSTKLVIFAADGFSFFKLTLGPTGLHRINKY